MKRLFAFLLFWVLCFESLQAQPFGEASEGYRLYRMDYSNGSGEKGKTWFYYNASHQMVQSNWVLDNQTRSSVNRYVYNQNGQLISAFRQFSDSMTSAEIFIYNNAGYLAEEHFTRSDGVEGNATYNYEKGTKTKATLSKYKGWLNGDITYSYYADGRKKEGILTGKSGVAANITYSYSADGNLLNERWDFNGQWWQVFEYHYERVDQNPVYYTLPYLNNNYRAKIISEDYTYNNQVGGPSAYSYNQRNQLESKIFKRSDCLQTITSYSYDTLNRVIESIRQSNQKQTELRFTYQYDPSDNLVERSYWQNDSLVGYELYQYNDIHQVVKAFWKNYDNWLSGTISYRYNAAGQLSEANFSSLNKNNATIHFQCDSLGNIIQVKWLFDSGDFQEYKYEYKK